MINIPYFNEEIKKSLVYIVTTIILFSGVYYFIDSLPKTITVEVTMKQNQSRNIQVFYKQNPYDVRNLNIDKKIEANDNFETIEFKINENYIYALDLQLNNNPKGNINNIEIKDITVKTLFSKRTLDSFNDFTLTLEEESNNRFTIVDNWVFSIFQLTTKLKIISLCFALFIVYIFRKQLNSISN